MGTSQTGNDTLATYDPGSGTFDGEKIGVSAIIGADGVELADASNPVPVDVQNSVSQLDKATFFAGTSAGVMMMGATTTDEPATDKIAAVGLDPGSRGFHTASKCVGAGLSIKAGISAGSGSDLTAISSNPCLIDSASFSNDHATDNAYVRFYNLASGSVTVGTSTVAAGPYLIPPGGREIDLKHPLEFDTACSFSVTSGSMAANDTSSVAAAQVSWTIQHKDS